MIASDDYYEQVKDSEAARKIRGLHRQVDRLSGSQPVIIRSSGINEDNYGDAQAGKYLSVIQAGGDVFRTCLKVMASGYRPEVCPQGIPQPMALIIQQCIDCRYGGVVMSFQSFQDDTVRIEYTLGQPRGAAVAGQSGNTPHRIDICRREGAENFQYFPGKVSSYFVLHKNNNGYSETFEVRSLRDEILTLSNRFEALKKTIRSGLETIILLLDNGKNRQITFHQWLTACQQLKSSLQALNPKEVEQVRSVHELIFALHRRFVNALAPISQHSGQGELSKEKKITYLDYTTQRNPGEKAPLSRPSSKPLIEKLNCYGTVVIMDDVLIVNLKLGSHVCLIDLLEYAEGGKERTLRLKFSDQFYKDDGVGKTAKLKRMWLLVQLLKVLQLDENADSMKLNCNAVAGGITVECTRMKSTKNMQDAFEKLIIVLRDMRNVDCKMQYIKVFEGDQWSFSLLAQRLTGDIAAEADSFVFQHCLFAMYYEQHFTCSPDYLLLLPEHYQQFINYAQRFAECRDKSCRDKSCRDKSCRDKSEDDYRQILISNEITEETRREFLHHLLFLDAKRTAPLVEDVYPDLRDKYYVIKPSSYSYRPSFEIPPDLWLSDDKEIFKKTLLMHGLQYGSQRVRNDKDLVLPIIAERQENLEFAGEKMKNDKEVVMTAIKKHGNWLQYVSPEIRDDENIVKAAIASYPTALRYASERIRSDKDIIKIVIDNDIVYLRCASTKVLSDREYLLNLIERDHHVFDYAADELRYDKDFIRSAIFRNPDVVEYVSQTTLSPIRL